MKRHRFDPFSFLFGALFLTVGCSFLFASPGPTAVRPFGSWPAAVVVAGLVLVGWAVARAVRPGAVAVRPGADAAPEGSDIDAHDEGEGAGGFSG
jgi:hypothetical protein